MARLPQTECTALFTNFMNWGFGTVLLLALVALGLHAAMCWRLWPYYPYRTEPGSKKRDVVRLLLPTVVTLTLAAVPFAIDSFQRRDVALCARLYPWWFPGVTLFGVVLILTHLALYAALGFISRTVQNLRAARVR